jgi:ribonuclease HI
MRAGWAVYHGRSGYLNRFGFVATNDIASETLNRANLEGVRQALSIVPVGAPIELCLNSEFVVNCFTVWLEKWRINGFRNVRNEPIAHGPIIKSCLDLARRKNIDMTFKFIPAGINNFGSDAADFYAHAGAFKYGGDTLMPMLDPELGSI